jgi:hypothetical protein
MAAAGRRAVRAAPDDAGSPYQSQPVSRPSDR